MPTAIHSTNTIEHAVERLYAHVAPSAKHIDTIRSKLDHALAEMRTQAEQETARQQRRLAKLTDERTKLLHAYYQGAIRPPPSRSRRVASYFPGEFTEA